MKKYFQNTVLFFDKYIFLLLGQTNKILNQFAQLNILNGLIMKWLMGGSVPVIFEPKNVVMSEIKGYELD